jgi:hypothetical protein
VREGAIKGSMRPLAIIACVVCAVAAFGLSLQTYMDVYLFGFPDSHVTDYQKAAGPPLTGITWSEAGFGLVFLALAVSPIGTRVRTVGWLAALVGLVLVALAAQIWIPWYFGTHLGLDNGIGG